MERFSHVSFFLLTFGYGNISLVKQHPQSAQCTRKARVGRGVSQGIPECRISLDLESTCMVSKTYTYF